MNVITKAMLISEALEYVKPEEEDDDPEGEDGEEEGGRGKKKSK